MNNRGRLKLLGTAVVAALAIVAIGMALAYRVNSASALERESQRQCQVIEDLKGAIRDVLRDGRSRVIARRASLSETEYLFALRYYQRQLDRFKERVC